MKFPKPVEYILTLLGVWAVIAVLMWVIMYFDLAKLS